MSPLVARQQQQQHARQQPAWELKKLPHLSLLHLQPLHQGQRQQLCGCLLQSRLVTLPVSSRAQITLQCGQNWQCQGTCYQQDTHLLQGLAVGCFLGGRPA